MWDLNIFCRKTNWKFLEMFLLFLSPQYLHQRQMGMFCKHMPSQVYYWGPIHLYIWWQTVFSTRRMHICGCKGNQNEKFSLKCDILRFTDIKMCAIWYVTQGLNWTLNIQYSGQAVVIEKAYLNINQVCLFTLSIFLFFLLLFIFTTFTLIFYVCVCCWQMYKDFRRKCSMCIRENFYML